MKKQNENENFIVDYSLLCKSVTNKSDLNYLLELLENNKDYKVIVNGSRIISTSDFLLSFVKRYCSFGFTYVVLKVDSNTNKRRSIFD